jgi:AraC-like DNA-binding protein
MAHSEASVKVPDFVSQQVTAARRFYLNLNPQATRGLAVVCGGWEECAENYSIDRASFPYFSLEFVARGRGSLVLDGRPHELRAGSVFSYGPGISQTIHTSSEQPLLKYFVDMTGDRAKALLKECRLPAGSLATLDVFHEVRQAFDLLIRQGLEHDRHAPRATALQCELLVLALERAVRPRSVSEQRAQATFERCRQHLEARFLTLRTVEALAQACHVDVSYLSRLFRRFLGDTPFRYLQRLQMQWAAERLHGSRCLVREVADELAMDPFQFSRMFKRVHGVSPSDFMAVRR